MRHALRSSYVFIHMLAMQVRLYPPYPKASLEAPNTKPRDYRMHRPSHHDYWAHASDTHTMTATCMHR